MTEVRFWELVNREVDRELSESEHSELEAFCQQNPELVACRDEMKKMTDLLDRVEDVEPPEGLESRVALAIDRRRTRAANITPVRPDLTGFWHKIGRNPALSFVGGAAVGAALLALVLKMAPDTILLNNRDLTGTIIAGDRVSEFVPQTEEEINTPQVTGSIESATQGSMVSVRVELNSERPIDLAVEFDPAQLAVTGFSSREDRTVPASVNRTAIRLGHSGRNRYDLVWSRIGSDVTVVRLVLSAGDVIFERSLTIGE